MNDDYFCNHIKPINIASTDLYFDEETKNVYSDLISILNETNFNNFMSKLNSKSGFAANLCVLISGNPGTGKTQMCYQIAKETDRDVIPVDLSEIYATSVGDSEKNIKSLFKNYKLLANVTRKLPILLINEADGIFSTRITVRNSVDQMHNAMQSILLEELENFRGILMATTNRKDNFDKAFDRRFTHKIVIPPPSKTVQEKIWNVMLPEISAEWIKKAVTKYNLSGGQIKSIAFKFEMNTALGKVLSYQDYEDLCASEFTVPSRIGFQ
jgi:SpoVK/Ycf46/Vps4 family AAA+-type ATPase